MGRALPAETVGWVERSETHHLRHREGDGFRRALPILRTVKQILGVIARLRPGDPVFQRRQCSNRDVSGILDSPLSRGMTAEGKAHLHIPAAHSCPSDASFVALEARRAQGMPDAGRTHGPPANRKAGGSHHRQSRNNRHSLRDGFNGCFVLSLECRA